jgi:hypothetical protein
MRRAYGFGAAFSGKGCLRFSSCASRDHQSAISTMVRDLETRETGMDSSQSMRRAAAAAGLSSLAIRALAAALLVFGNAMILFRAAVVTMPLYHGDEYAHWANAGYLAIGQSHQQFNPYLLRMSNYLYFLVTEWLARAPEGPAAMRLMNYLFIVLSALFVRQLARTFVSAPLALLAAAFVFAIGFTTYSVSVMPEMMFMCIFLGLALFLVRAWAPRRILRSFVAGLFVGALMMIKPHGVALLPAVATMMVAVPMVQHRRLAAIVAAVPDVLAMAAGAIATVISIASIATGTLELSPVAFVGDAYGTVLARPGAASSIAAGLGITRYFLAHVVVLLLFFAPAVLIAPPAALLLSGRQSPTADDAAGLRSFLVLVTFTLASTLAIFGMIAIFSHLSSGLSASEADRIHGRYWGFLIPLLMTLTVVLFEFSNRVQAISPRANRWLERAGAVGWLLAILAFVIVISPAFRIFPWDFPELFALYRNNNPTWPYAAWFPSSFAVVIALLTACAFLRLLTFPARRLCYAAFLAVAFALGNINTTGWQIDIMPNVRPLVEAGEAAVRIVGRQSEGLFVTPEYWGTGQYVAFQLPLRSFVAIKPKSATLTDADVPAGAEWVLTMAPYTVQFKYSSTVPLGPLTLYLRSPDS